MKKIFFAFVSLFLSLALLSQQKFNDLVKFKTEEHDFGKIKQNVPVTHDFGLANISKAPVVFESALASCGCTTPVKPEQPVMPGKSDKLTAGYNAAAPGPFTKTITVKLAGVEETKIITIKGEVLSAEEYEAYLKSKTKENKADKPNN